jgi:hypothetical protein
MAKLIDTQKIKTSGVLSPYQFLTLYFPGFVLALGYSIATPAIVVAEQIAYSAAFALFAFCSLATAALLAFSVKETVGRGKL